MAPPFEQLIRSLPDGLILLDQTGLITYMNPCAESMIGAELSQAIGKHWKDVFTVKVDEASREQTGSLMEILQEQPLLIPMSGPAVPIEFQIAPVEDGQGRSIGSMLVLHDVTDRKLEKEGLKESRAKYKSLVNSIEGVVWEAEGETMRIRFVSNFVEKLLGYPPKRWLDDDDFLKSIIHPDDRQQVLDVISQAVQQRESYQIEYRVTAADGRTLLVRDSVTLSVDENQQVRLTGVLTDMTNARLARDELIQSQEKFSIAFYANPAPMLLIHESGKILDVNESCEKLTGHVREGLLERTVTEAGLCRSQEFESLVHTLREKGHVHDVKWDSLTKRVLLGSFTRINLSDGPCVLGVLTAG